MVEAILLDFGGVLAEEGFKNGLKAIAGKNGLEPDFVAKKGSELVYSVGYVVGRSEEGAFWEALRRETGIKGDDRSLRNLILSSFRLRPFMLAIVRELKNAGIPLYVLSDQTNWLDELNERDGFFKLFDSVYNSYHVGKGKRDPSIFDDAAGWMKVRPEEILFVDDNQGNIERAESRGLKTILFKGEEGFIKKLVEFCPFIAKHTP